MARLAFRKHLASCVWRVKRYPAVILLIFCLVVCAYHPALAATAPGEQSPAWACSSTAWPVGDSVTECAPGVCNPTRFFVGGSIVNLNTGQTLYTHGGAYMPTELSISDCCLLCRSTAQCQAWTYCNDPKGCGGADSCKKFLAGSQNRAVVKGASSRPVCTQDGSWPHTLCTLKNKMKQVGTDPHAAIAEASVNNTRLQRGAKLTFLFKQAKQTHGLWSKSISPQAAATAPAASGQLPGSDSGITGAPGTQGQGWVSGILAPVTSNPPCPADLHHLGCFECAHTRNVPACHQCTLKYGSTASNAALYCGICANLKASSAVQTCIEDVLQSSSSWCMKWQSSSSSNSGTAVDLKATEQCFECMRRTGGSASACARLHQ